MILSNCNLRRKDQPVSWRIPWETRVCVLCMYVNAHAMTEAARERNVERSKLFGNASGVAHSRSLAEHLKARSPRSTRPLIHMSSTSKGTVRFAHVCTHMCSRLRATACFRRKWLGSKHQDIACKIEIHVKTATRNWQSNIAVISNIALNTLFYPNHQTWDDQLKLQITYRSRNYRLSNKVWALALHEWITTPEIAKRVYGESLGEWKESLKGVSRLRRLCVRN